MSYRYRKISFSLIFFLFKSLFFKTFFIIVPVFTADVCSNKLCQCSPTLTTVNCDTKGWENLDDIDFPSSVHILTLVNNKLKFDKSKKYIDKIYIYCLCLSYSS